MNAAILHSLLRRVGRLTLAVNVAGAAMVGLALLASGVTACLLIDAATGLPAGGLFLLDAVLVGLMCGALCHMGWRTAASRYDPKRIALTIERRANIAGSRLINAVDLCGHRLPGVSEQLQGQAVRLGDDLAGTIRPWSVVDTSRLKRAGLYAGVALVLMLLLYLLAPRVFHAVTPRLLQPRADHPPFTCAQFDVQIEPRKLMFGKQALIRVKLGGRSAPDSAAVVFVEGGRHRAPLPMTPRPGEADAFGLELPRAVRSGSFYVDTPAGRSKRYDLIVHPTPLFERVQVSYEFPSYTGWQSRRESLGDRGIAALAGSTVTVTVTSNVALKQGDLTLPVGQVELRTGGTNTHSVDGAFTLTESGKYAISLTGADGTASDRVLRGNVVCIPDNPPQVYFTEPAPRVVVAKGATVGVKVVAADDIAITRIMLQRRMNTGSPLSIDLPPAKTDKGLATAELSFDLDAMEVREGDRITYFATAHDSRPGKGQSTDTSVYTIEVVSRQQYADYGQAAERVAGELADMKQRLARLQQQRLSRLDELKSLQQPATGKPLADEQRRRMTQLEAELADVDGQAAELAAKIGRHIEKGPTKADTDGESDIVPIDVTNRVEVYEGRDPGPGGEAVELASVPMRFRELAAAYFRRLADEAEQR